MSTDMSANCPRTVHGQKVKNVLKYTKFAKIRDNPSNKAIIKAFLQILPDR